MRALLAEGRVTSGCKLEGGGSEWSAGRWAQSSRGEGHAPPFDAPPSPLDLPPPRGWLAGGVSATRGGRARGRPALRPWNVSGGLLPGALALRATGHVGTLGSGSPKSCRAQSSGGLGAARMRRDAGHTGTSGADRERPAPQWATYGRGTPCKGLWGWVRSWEMGGGGFLGAGIGDYE